MIDPAVKVFGIGLSKTGTSSLDRALNELGIRSVHYPHDPATFRQLAAGDYRLKILQRYQGVTDIPVAPFYPQLDAQFPGSKFILTIRDEESWLQSIQNHWEFMREWAARDEQFRVFNEFIVSCVYGTHDFNRDRFLYVYREHEAAVRRYFANRPGDLAVLNVCAGDGWETLCPFLGLPIPQRSFPHANRREEKADSREWMRQLDEALLEFSKAVPPDAAYVLLDECQLAGTQLDDPDRVRRLVERDGEYWGLPETSDEAIACLESLREEGVRFAVLGWPCFWWLEHYPGFAQHLHSRYPVVVDEDAIRIYDLAVPAPAAVAAEGYTQVYFKQFRKASRSSAEVVAPRVLELIEPQCVVDVGCGVGEWAAAFKRLGIGDVLGVDGADVVGDLAISPDEFLGADLAQPFSLDRRFDLAVALEVAEHLPAAAADQFVDTLVRLAPVVLFSAAVPDQGGCRHVNEQWPSYWAERFASHGYQPLDVLRREFWNDGRVQWWYAQNMVLYADDSHWTQIAARLTVPPPDGVLSLVHPRKLEQAAWRIRVLEASVELMHVVPPGGRVILADDGLFGPLLLPRRTVLPFTEADGQYAGPPADEAAAVAEVRRQRSAGAGYMAFGWPSFWHLDFYAQLDDLLRTQARLVFRNERLVVFAL